MTTTDFFSDYTGWYIIKGVQCRIEHGIIKDVYTYNSVRKGTIYRYSARYGMAVPKYNLKAVTFACNGDRYYVRW